MKANVKQVKMDDRDIEWVKSLAKSLADTINVIGEEFNIKRIKL